MPAAPADAAGPAGPAGGGSGCGCVTSRSFHLTVWMPAAGGLLSIRAAPPGYPGVQAGWACGPLISW